MAKTFKADGEKHTVKKNKKGEVIVDHAGKKGKYDKINLTKKAGAKTVAQGVKATKKWHSSEANKKIKDKMKKKAREEKLGRRWDKP
jgi:hypothetical protein